MNIVFQITVQYVGEMTLEGEPAYTLPPLSQNIATVLVVSFVSSVPLGGKKFTLRLNGTLLHVVCVYQVNYTV